jgi:small subunit ribosomal protein S4
VRHGHVELNGKRLSIPSARVRVGDVVSVAEKSRRMQPVLHAVAVNETRQSPSWIEVDKDSMRATVRGVPARGDIDIPVQESAIVELYSK